MMIDPDLRALFLKYLRIMSGYSIISFAAIAAGWMNWWNYLGGWTGAIIVWIAFAVWYYGANR
jgi:hypothetical protein